MLTGACSFYLANCKTTLALLVYTIPNFFSSSFIHQAPSSFFFASISLLLRMGRLSRIREPLSSNSHRAGCYLTSTYTIPYQQKVSEFNDSSR